MKAGLSISIWFFIGLSLLVNGVIIFGAGVYELIQPPPPEARCPPQVRKTPRCDWHMPIA